MITDLTREEVTGLKASNVWHKIKQELEERRMNIMEEAYEDSVVIPGDAIQTAMNAVAATTELRLLRKFINIDEWFFGIDIDDEGG